MVLLTWTAADVLNPALCGLDELPLVAANITVDEDTPASKQPAFPADDCFCCSHNVNFAAVAQVAESLVSDAAPIALLSQNPRWTNFPLYHPPRILS